MAEKYNSRQERRKQTENQKKAKKKPKRGMFKRIMMILGIFVGIGLIAGGAAFAYFVSGTPELDESLLKDPIASKIYDVDKKLLSEEGIENREYVNYEDIPELVQDAVLATEDVRFYDHHGIDFYRLGAAVLSNVTNGFGSQGASTLTQQVVKRSYLTPDKTIKRKVQEMWLSIKLEQKYTKEEIFEMYVNKIFYGNRANGISTAAKTYYGKDLKDLTLNEVAMLVGLPQSPSNYEPYGHPDKAKKRRDVVLHLMNKHGYISKEEMEKNQAIAIEQGLKDKDTSKTDTTPYDAFIDEVIEEVQSMGDYNVYTDGLEIYTTIDRDAQEYVYKLLNTNDIVQYPNEKLQAGITLLDTESGEIRAIGGGRNTTVKRGFNYATEAKRSPGSTIKPIIDYGPAVEYLNWSTYQPIIDEPYQYTNGTPIKNAGGTYKGQVTAREALARSLNIPALKTYQAVEEYGEGKGREFAEKLGVPIDNINESASIGSMDSGISSMELAGAYSAFGNNGIYNKPHTVTKIVLRDKTAIKQKVESKAVMKESTAFIISDMLKSVINESYGTGIRAKVPGLPMAGKTGSTNFTPEEKAANGIPADGVRDSWMGAYTTNYTVGVWAGYDNKPKEKLDYVGSSSQRIPKEIIKNLMQYVSKNKETKDFKQPNSVVKVQVVKGSNPAVLANSYTPSHRITNEYYVKGHEPTQVTKEYTKLGAPQGLTGAYNQELNEINLNWSYPTQDEGTPEFEVKVSIDGGGSNVLSLSSDTGLTIQSPTAGASYSFSVTAILNGQRSDAATTSVSVPGEIEEEPIEEPEEEEIPEPEDPNQGTEPDTGDNEEDPGDQDNGNNGNGNGNGNEGSPETDPGTEKPG
ncbi:PBP1A family penicillin-binding protein, partial [Peribacillus psychrosaccharolyticus]